MAADCHTQLCSAPCAMALIVINSPPADHVPRNSPQPKIAPDLSAAAILAQMPMQHFGAWYRQVSQTGDPVLHSARLLGLATAIAALLSFTSATHAAPASSGVPKLQRDGTVSIAGRNLRCGGARNVLDRRLPSEGAAAPGVLIINPRLINRMPPVVRVFVYYHECGHHNIGASELRADCWAVNRGVREGWLDRAGLRQVCRSFGNMPRTPTHPSSRARCRNLDRCFARAVTAQAPLPVRKPAVAHAAADETTKLLSGPELVGTGSTAEDDQAVSSDSSARRRAIR